MYVFALYEIEVADYYALYTTTTTTHLPSSADVYSHLLLLIIVSSPICCYLLSLFCAVLPEELQHKRVTFIVLGSNGRQPFGFSIKFSCSSLRYILLLI